MTTGKSSQREGEAVPFTIGAQVRAVNRGSDGSTLVVVSIVPGGPCDRAGVCRGDTLLEVEGDRVSSLDSLAECMAALSHRVAVDIRLRRLAGHMVCIISPATLPSLLRERH